jgi:two-component system KDP operon response regulator KdpE
MNETVAADVQPEILIIEDDSEIRRFLKTTLSAAFYQPQEAANAAEGLTMATYRPPDAILLDLGLPDCDGVEVIHQIRKWNQRLPIVVLSARSDERNKVAALDAGADDYINKPFSAGELLARLRAVFRRSAAASSDNGAAIFSVGDLAVDLAKRRIRVAGKEVHLTRIEYKLLEVMVRQAGRVLTHGQLLSEVWGPRHEEQAHYVRVYMAQLRRKLETDPARPRYLRTEPGVGYRLATE